ncbi:histidine kinase [Methanobacterium lacus]|uniref:histidine kinase n=1 Tax=Methanobacterium lacus (strain AL-21) TaxID=877455 RepID=F0T5V4_METLA|nr:ATP-binding protein [Methanobacterium lacus]ADZ09347.1 histidine kinase [Methanobacterium lacus]
MISGFLIAIPSLDPIYNILGRGDYFILLLLLLVILMVALLTERVEKVRTLNKLNQELKTEAMKLEDANNELEAFAYSVSHDLRVPLRAIDGFSRIVIEDYEKELDEEGVRLLNVIRDNTKKMGQLIDDILLLSRAGRQEMNNSKLDMTSLAKNVYNEFQQDVSSRNIDFVVEDMPPVDADRALMTQVLTNLIGNAIKFTKKTENPRIELGYTEDEANYIYHVKDNGAGFNMKYYDKLFGLFQRLHSQEEFEGTGVGLSIVQRIISRHNGRVWGEGEVGKGATIYFSLPKTK